MNSHVPSCEESVTIVSGLPRSGTSMMMQMLTAGGIAPWKDEVRVDDDDNPKGYYEYEKVKSLARDNSWLNDAKGHVIKIVAPLLPSIPAGSYRIVFMDRDMDEILRSQSKMLERSGKAGARLSTEQLSKVFQGHLLRAEDFVQSAGYPLLHVAHRNCVENPTEVASKLNDFFDGGLDEAAMTAMVDASLYRQRS